MKQLFKKSLEVVLSLKEWKYIDQFFLIPLTMWTTIETAFLTAQFTRVRKNFIDLFKIKSIQQGFYYLSYWYSVRVLDAFFLFKIAMKISEEQVFFIASD